MATVIRLIEVTVALLASVYVIGNLATKLMQWKNRGRYID